MSGDDVRLFDDGPSSLLVQEKCHIRGRGTRFYPIIAMSDSVTHQGSTQSIWRIGEDGDTCDGICVTITRSQLRRVRVVWSSKLLRWLHPHQPDTVYSGPRDGLLF